MEHLLPKPLTASGSAHRFLLEGGGDMGDRLRRHDWARHPLGPPAEWPRSLTSAISIAFHSRYPMFVWWGPQLFNFYNDAYAPMLGGRHPDAFARPARETWHDIWDDVGPLARQVMEDGQATWADRMLLVMERHGYPEETYFTFSYSPLPADDGSIGGVFCAVIENTAEVLAERRVRTLRALAAAGLEARTVDDACQRAFGALEEDRHDLPFALLYVDDRDGGARLACAARTWSEAMAPARIALDDDDGGAWPLARVMAGGRAEVVEDLAARFGTPAGGAPPAERAWIAPLVRPGAERAVGVLIAGLNPHRPLDDDYRGFLELVSGQIASTIGHAQLREEEIAHAKALAELDRAKTMFFTNVSHEFRTPLTLMLGPIADALGRDAVASDPDTHALLTLAARHGDRLLKLVNTLLDFSRIEAGRTQARFERTDVAALTAELASTFRSAIEKAGLELVVECSPGPGDVFVDRDLWEKIVLNLLSNALKFTFEGRIEVRLRCADDHVELRVSDTGVGIAADQLPRVFERFHRVDTVRARTFEGTGIGLALVAELTHVHGGAIHVESVEGHGTTFVVRIPTGTAHLPADHVADTHGSSVPVLAAPFVNEAMRWLPGAADDAGAVVAAPAATPDGHRPRVLLVDDNADMRAYVRRLLAGAFEVETAADGVEALARCADAVPDLILTDVMMPNLDGFGLLAAVRSDPALRDVPVVLLSARAGEEARIQGLRAGADDYVVKPFGAHELLARVTSRLELSRLRARFREERTAVEREAARVVRASEARFRTMADHSPIMIWVTEPDGACTFLNRTWYAFTGQTPEEALGFGWLDAVHADDRERAGETFRGANRRHVPFRLEYRLRRHDGVYRWAIDAAAPRFDDDGVFLGYIGSVIDITERKEAEQHLERTVAERTRDLAGINDQLETFVYSVAHDLRAPLRSMSGYSDLLLSERGGSLDAEGREMLERIRGSALFMDRLLLDLMSYGRAARTELELGAVDVAAAWDMALFQSEAELRRTHAQVDVAGPLPRVRAHLATLAQCLANLLGNAVKFVPAGREPRVRFRAEDRGALVRLWVEDNGIGIAPEHHEKAFRLFERLEAGHQEGTGIGLFIVRKAVERMEGRVGVESQAGDGSRFWIELPKPAVVASD